MNPLTSEADTLCAASSSIRFRHPAFMIQIGQWLFRYRNALFPSLFAIMALLIRPHVPFGNRRLDQLLILCGVVVALLGETIRLLTIGCEYIERGGKNKQVWASRLVQGGMYAHTRNPMYLGNMLIAAGLCLFTGAPAAYVIVLPFFVFAYCAIVAAEEHYLGEKFSSSYAEYCRQIPRFLPSLRGIRRSFSITPYDGRRAIRKDLSTIIGLLMALSVLPLWRVFFLKGFDAATHMFPLSLLGFSCAAALFWGVHELKKRRSPLLYSPND